MAEHRVFAHLGLVARDYDAQIRRWIPAYETMIDVVVGLVPGGDILDLGTGTGALAAAILDKRSDTRVTLVDIDPAMLEVARERVTPHAARVEVVTATFEGGLRPCDAVVASLALHHVADRDAKQRLYATIFAALRPGGMLAIADTTVHATGREREIAFARWAGWMAEHGIARSEADALFAAWAGEDHYRPLAEELALLAAAGFSRPDVFWKDGPSTVYGAFR